MRIPGISQDTRRLLLSLVLVILSSAVLLPGKSGPFIFDDYTNLIDNTYIKLRSLDLESLHQAAYSLEAGPLKRPIAMASLALNHYFAGSFSDSTPYKLTNIAIHAVNGVLVLWLSLLLFGKLGQTDRSIKWSPQARLFLATAAAVIWTVHPIQVSSVLYVIQRMTELSAMFTVLALICYLKGRTSQIQGKPVGIWLMTAGTVSFGILAMFSKENALLLPVYILLIELVLFRNNWPWVRWGKLNIQTRRTIVLVLAIALLALLLGAILYALPSYSVRRFNMTERVLTEARVVFFYLSLIFIPRINRFGHQHDDIPLSESLFNPWTTLPAVMGHVVLIGMAIFLLVRNKHRLLSFGILWFYASHLLESTFFGLEIAYEHRNYLALLGPIMVSIWLVEMLRTRLGWVRARWMLSLAVFAFASITFLRASQWEDQNSFYRYEALHHPDSARVQVGLSILLGNQRLYPEAMQAIRHAIEIDSQEAGYWLHLHLMAAHAGVTLSLEDHQKPIDLMKTGPLSATVFLALQNTGHCLQTWCQSLQVPLETWAQTILNRQNAPHDKSFYYYLIGLSKNAQGKIQDAIKYLHLAYKADPAYLHPLFALANIHVQRRELAEAEEILELLQRANSQSRHPRTPELKAFQKDVEALRLIVRDHAMEAPSR